MNDNSKTIERFYRERQTKDGAGVKLSRVFGYHEIPQIDPFLMLDFFNSEDPKDYEKGFPWHPHRGIETVTYLIQGQIMHGDSLGNKGVIQDGDCQWMTAGSGIIHQELPVASQKMLGLQLWINLPKAHKMTKPAYRDLRANTLPIVKTDFGEVRVLCGKYENVEGPVEAVYVKPEFFDFTMKNNKQLTFTATPNFNYFILSVDGAGWIGDKSEANGMEHMGEGCLLSREGGEINVFAGDEGFRFILIGGEPLNEPIAWGGPIVMNNKAELTLAFSQIEEGTFIRTL